MFQVLHHCLIFSRNKLNYWGPCTPLNVPIALTSATHWSPPRQNRSSVLCFHALSPSAAALITHKPTLQTGHSLFSGSADHLQTPNSGTDVWKESYLQRTGKAAEAEVIRWQRPHRVLSFLLTRGNGVTNPAPRGSQHFIQIQTPFAERKFPLSKPGEESGFKARSDEKKACVRCSPQT